jgi:hypothetical protein
MSSHFDALRSLKRVTPVRSVRPGRRTNGALRLVERDDSAQRAYANRLRLFAMFARLELHDALDRVFDDSWPA